MPTLNIADVAARVRVTGRLEPLSFPDIKDAEGKPKTSRVKHITGRAVRLVREMHASKDFARAWEAAALLLPDLTPEEVEGLEMDEALGVIAYASGTLEAVEGEIQKLSEAGEASAEGNPPAPVAAPPVPAAA